MELAARGVRKWLLLTLFLPLHALLPPAPAHAIDGAIEISQTIALAGGEGDPPGFPVLIAVPGSYILTSPLTVVSPSENAIEITAPRVTLDLGGFTIGGPVDCTGSGAGISCASAGTGTGISTAMSKVTVRNGVVNGFPAGGVETRFAV